MVIFFNPSIMFLILLMWKTWEVIELSHMFSLNNSRFPRAMLIPSSVPLNLDTR